MTHRWTRVLGLAVMTGTIWMGAGCSYNKFTTQEEAIKAQWSEVDNQLQRRNDLIPNLVETVKGFAAQEQTVMKDVTDARAKMAGAQTPTDKIAAANAESSALSRLLVVVENYPNLKSDAQFMRLQDELAGTENRLTTARMRYNQAVQEYETARKKFPGNITAKMFGFKDHPYWEVPADAKGVPKVDFGRGRGGGV
jgi:LemA protein